MTTMLINSRSSWTKKPTKYIFSVLSGVTPSTYESSYWNGDIYWVTLEDIKALKGKLILDTKRKITEKAFDDCRVKLAPVGSIILTTRANVGNLALAGVQLCTNQGCKTLVPNFLNINTNYFYYQLLARKEELLMLAKGKIFPELETYDLRNFELWVPPISIQNQTTEYLDSETAKIDALILAKEKFLKLLAERRLVMAYTVKSNHKKVYLESTANIKQLSITPPIQEEQKAISKHLKVVNSLNELINTIHSTIKLLNERRAALIEAVVNGTCTQ